MAIYMRAKIDMSARANGYGIIEGELLTHYEYCRKYHMTDHDFRFFDLVDTTKNNIYTMFGVRKPIHVDKIRVLPDDEKEKWYDSQSGRIE